MSSLAEVRLVSFSGCRNRGFTITSDRTSTFGGQRLLNDSGQRSEVIPYLVMINVAGLADGNLGGDIDLQTSNHLNGKRSKINKAPNDGTSIK